MASFRSLLPPLLVAALALSLPGGCASRPPSAASLPPATAPPPTAVAAAEAVPDAVSTPRVSSERVGQLRRQLEAVAGRAPGRSAAIYWEDLVGGGSAAVHPEKVFRSASLIKIPVAAAAVAHWEQHPGERTSERERQLWKMIAESNNVVVDHLAEQVGGLDAVNAFCRAQGWRETEMNHHFRDWRTRRRHNFTSARDVAAMLRAIDRGELVSAAASEHLWGVLRDQTMRQRIPTGLPAGAGAEVGNKTGTLLTALHDAAIVRSARARYLLVIMIADPRSEPAGDAYCRRVSRLVWDTVAGGRGSG